MIPHLLYITSWLGRPIIKFGKTDLEANATCSQCGGPIRCDVRKQGRMFCSRACETNHYNGKRQRKAIEVKACGHCGEVFTAKRTDARYCSARCRQAARRSRASQADRTNRPETAPQQQAAGSQGTDPAAAPEGAHEGMGPVEEVNEPGFARAAVL